MSKHDLIDLAVEYSMVKSTLDFNNMNAKQQAAILKQIQNVVTPELEANCRKFQESWGA